MGSYLPENPASTGDLTRIVAKGSKAASARAIEQSKASKKIFLQICLFLSAFYFNHITFSVNSNS